MLTAHLPERGGPEELLHCLLLMAAVCALFAWLTPTHDLPWTSFHAEFSMALAGLLAGAGVLWRRGRPALAIPVLALLTLLAAMVSVVQGIAGVIEFRGDVALVCLYLLGFALTLAISHHAANEWGRQSVLLAFAWLVLVGALASTWLALYQWQQLDYLGLFASDLAAGGRPYANFNQPNHLAALLVLALVATALLYDAAKLGAVLSLALVVLLGFSLSMTQSRAGSLAVAVGAAVLIGKRHSLGRTLTLRHIFAGVLVILSLSLAWDAANSFLGQASGRSAADATVASTRRLIHWSSMFDAILRHPWIGYGWNQSVLAQFAVAPDHPSTFEVFTYNHNILIDLIIWNGVPLGLVFLIGLGLWFRAGWRGTSDSTAVLALAGVAAMFVLALLEYPLYYAYFLLPTGVLMGAISAVAMPHAVLKVPAWLAPALLAIAGFTMTMVAFDYMGLEQDVRSLRFERARIGMDRPQHVLSQPVLLTHVAAFAQFARTPERKGMNAAELRSMEEVVQRFPSAENIVRYAAALALNDRQAQATEVLRRVCKIHSLVACESNKRLWRALGERQAAIAGVPWPKN